MSVSKGFDTRSVAVVTTPSWISCTFLLHHIHPSTAACMFQYRAETVQLFVLHGIVAEALSWKKSNLFKKKSPARLHYPFPPTTLWVISKSLLKIPPHTSEERVIFAPFLEKIFDGQKTIDMLAGPEITFNKADWHPARCLQAFCRAITQTITQCHRKQLWLLFDLLPGSSIPAA